MSRTLATQANLNPNAPCTTHVTVKTRGQVPVAGHVPEQLCSRMGTLVLGPGLRLQLRCNRQFRSAPGSTQVGIPTQYPAITTNTNSNTSFSSYPLGTLGSHAARLGWTAALFHTVPG
eukprot:2627743-Rhodomonas_salina.3